VTNKTKTREAGGTTTEEKRYPDPYGLYQRWFSTVEDIRNETSEDTISAPELVELWRRWFEAKAGPRRRVVEAEDDFLESMAPLWKEMAEDISAKMLSGETLPEDPLRFFLQWYNETSEKWSKAADKLLREDETLESMSRFFEAYVSSHRESLRASEERSKNLRIPTSSDVARVAKLVVVVENKVDRIEEAFEEFIYGDSEPATSDSLGDLGERMDRLESKMDRILAALEKLGNDNTSLEFGEAVGETDMNREKARGIKARGLGYS
jgi:polyhydroxyalkanoic acid synthase PhaR subunit